MKNIIPLVSVWLCLSSFAVHNARAGDILPPKMLQEQIPELMQKARVPGLAIAKIESGSIVWEAAYGERAPGEPLTVDTVFNAASLTKPVFAVTALHLVADGIFSLDSSLENMWVDPDVADDPRHKELTPRILLSQQSGFPNWRGNHELQFMFTPGTRHEYSGEGFEYLRRAIEHGTGTQINVHATMNVFEPAGMRHTTMGWTDAIGTNVARGFDENAEPIDTNLEGRGPNAAAHLMTTVNDYARFLAWIGNGGDLPDNLFDQMRVPQALHDDPLERFGLGWKLIPAGSSEALMHDGREPGVRTYAIVLPESGEGLVILTNSSNGELVYRSLIKAGLANGETVVRSADQLIWQYLSRLPPQALIPMSRGIARSPSYLSTLLHAVDTVLVQASSLSVADKTTASQAVEPFVLALLDGDIESAQAEKLVEQLLTKEGDELHLVSEFGLDAAQTWLRALLDI
jgi:CubicO group peptidase (beta-lactamase class C family)